MLYIQKGSSNPNQNVNNLADIHLDYIEIPLLAIIKNSEKLSIEGGFHCSALIDGYFQDLYGELENQTSFDSFELGVIIGISKRSFSFIPSCILTPHKTLPPFLYVRAA